MEDERLGIVNDPITRTLIINGVPFSYDFFEIFNPDMHDVWEVSRQGYLPVQVKRHLCPVQPLMHPDRA